MTGAGMSVDSGVPDYRSKGGFAKLFPQLTRRGIGFMEMSNPKWFKLDREMMWAYCGYRLNLFREKEPHQGYRWLLEMVQNKQNNYFVYTSNIDGYFERAGYDPKKILECHGSMVHFQCLDGCSQEIWPAPDEEIALNKRPFKALEPFPTCKNCQGPARPNVLFFQDTSWIADRKQKQQNQFDLWIEEVRKTEQRLVIIEVGAGPQLPRIRWKSEELAEKLRVPLIRINPTDYQVPYGQIGLQLTGIKGIQLLHALQESI